MCHFMRQSSEIYGGYSPNVATKIVHNTTLNFYLSIEKICDISTYER